MRPRPLIPDWLETSFEDEGWILPDGRFVACYRPYVGPDHAMVAKFILGEDGESEADRRGWLRISEYGDRCAKPITQRQQDTLFDFCEHHKADYREVLADVRLLTLQPS